MKHVAAHLRKQQVAKEAATMLQKAPVAKHSVAPSTSHILRPGVVETDSWKRKGAERSEDDLKELGVDIHIRDEKVKFSSAEEKEVDIVDKELKVSPIGLTMEHVAAHLRQKQVAKEAAKKLQKVPVAKRSVVPSTSNILRPGAVEADSLKRKVAERSEDDLKELGVDIHIRDGKVKSSNAEEREVDRELKVSRRGLTMEHVAAHLQQKQVAKEAAKKLQKVSVAKRSVVPSTSNILRPDLVKADSLKRKGKEVSAPLVIEIEDEPSPRRQRVELPLRSMPVPDAVTERAPAPTTSFAQDVIGSLKLTDQQIHQMSIGSSESAGQSLAFALQAMVWAWASVTQSAADSNSLEKLQESLCAATVSAEESAQKAREADHRSKELKSQVAEADQARKALEVQVAKLEKQVQAAEEATLDASANWFGEGRKMILERARERGMDHTLLLDEGEVDPLQ